jgi:hypothetical protein
MTSIADGSAIFQTSSESVFSPTSWFGEVVVPEDVAESMGLKQA